jgi:hypothetical protein
MALIAGDHRGTGQTPPLQRYTSRLRQVDMGFSAAPLPGLQAYQDVTRSRSVCPLAHPPL